MFARKEMLEGGNEERAGIMFFTDDDAQVLV
jgi:hypothetical protein